MIKISKLNKKYQNREVLKDINLEIKGGSIFGLLGPNGAGKTTLISTLVGLTSASSGEIIVENKNIKDELKYIQSISSLIPQNLAFYPLLTAHENLEFFGGMLGLSGAILKSRIEYVVNITKLNDVYHQEAKTYSGGLKRRLNIAIGLLSDPKIIYLDEPTVGIDPQSRNFILESIKEMKQENRLIVYTSHYMQEVEFLCDRIAIIDKGEIIQEGSLNSLLSTFKVRVKTTHELFEVEIEKLSELIDGLLSDPKIIYLDEPTVGIDPQSRNFILESIKEMKQENRLIVYTSHYMQEVEFLCDRIAIIDKGEIIQEGSLNSLLSAFKVRVKTTHELFEVEIEKLSELMDRLLKDGHRIESIDYGQDLERYFLELTKKELRD